jgi:hypothetical protein
MYDDEFYDLATSSTRYSTRKRLAKRISILENELKANYGLHQTNKKDRNILRKQLKLLRDKKGYDTLKDTLAKCLSDNITSNVWVEKEIARGKYKITKLQVHQGYSHIKQAYLARSNDPLFANVITSVIHPNPSEETDTEGTTIHYSYNWCSA